MEGGKAKGLISDAVCEGEVREGEGGNGDEPIAKRSSALRMYPRTVVSCEFRTTGKPWTLVVRRMSSVPKKNVEISSSRVELERREERRTDLLQRHSGSLHGDEVLLHDV